MSLCGITDQKELQWRCPGNEDIDCDQLHTIRLEEAIYLLPPESENGRGSTIALPKCECGVQTFLKADYTLKELFKTTISFTNEYGDIWAYGLPYSHMYNMIAHHLLYQAGLAEHPPLIPMPSEDWLSKMQEMAPGGALSLWYGFAAVAIRQKEALPAPEEIALLMGGR